MLSEAQIGELLVPYGVRLDASSLAQLSAYLELLLRWNAKINLTAIRRPEECVTRHFGESLCLAGRARIEGRLLDIGSGAGFPGLALKLAFPDLAVTLLEPTAKKRAFLKEVARVCWFSGVEVSGQRLEEFVLAGTTRGFDAATSRAVGHLSELVPLAAGCLVPGGRIYLWVSHGQGQQLDEINEGLRWDQPMPIPLSREGEIWCGIRLDQ